MGKRRYWDYLNYMNKEVFMYEDDVKLVAHPGECYPESVEVANKDYFSEQFDKLTDEQLQDFCDKEFGSSGDRADCLVDIAFCVAWDIFDSEEFNK